MHPLFIGRNHIVLESVDSTNNYLASHEKLTKLPEGTLVEAKQQFAGRGQRDNVWLSAPGKNLTVSILFRPHFLDPENYFLLNKAITLAVVATIEEATQQPVHIKWPNDILVGGKKIAGLLIEISWRQNHFQNAIVGIGINVNQKENLPDHATSIRHFVAQDLNLDTIRESLCSHLEFQYLAIKTGKNEQITMSYRSCLMKLNQNIQLNFKGKQYEVELVGVDNVGRIMVRHKGKLHSLMHGDAKVVV